MKRIRFNNDHNYWSLAEAIVLQAVRDYENCTKKLLKGTGNDRDKWMMQECEDFIVSKWVKRTFDIDTDELLAMIDEELYAEYGGNYEHLL